MNNDNYRLDKNADHSDHTSDEEAVRSRNLLFDESSSESGKSIDSDKTEDPQYPWINKTTTVGNTGTKTNSRVDTPKGDSPKRLETTPRTTPMRSSIETPIPTIEESPTTKTINSFSQNMDDLQCEAPKATRSEPRSGMPPPPKFDLPKGYELDWEIHPIRIIPSSKESSFGYTQELGIVIVRGAFPSKTNEGGQTQRPHCFVNKLHEGGMGISSGLKPGDWFLRPMDVSSYSNSKPSAGLFESAVQNYEAHGPLQLATFDEISEWCKECFSEYRPILILRKRKPTNKTSETVNTVFNRPVVANSTAPSSSLKNQSTGEIGAPPSHTKYNNEASPKKRVTVQRREEETKLGSDVATLSCSSKTPSKVFQIANKSLDSCTISNKNNSSRCDDDDKSSSSSSSSKIPPYCILCNYYNPKHWDKNTLHGKKRSKPKRAPRHHHAWCPKNKAFDKARVEKILARMKHGYQVLGCEACHTEYQTGKVISLKKKSNTTDINNPNNENIEHNAACRMYQANLKTEERRKRKREEEREEKARQQHEVATLKKSTKQAKKRKQRPMAHGTQVSSGVKRYTADRRNGYRTLSTTNDSSNSSSYSEEDAGCCEDGSIYQPPTRKKRIKSFSYTQNRQDSDLRKAISTREKNSVKRSSHHQTVEEELQRLDRIGSRARIDSDDKQNRLVKAATNKNRNQSAKIEGNEVLDKPVWVPMDDNPWGDDGYQTGDILLYGPQRGVGHHETHLLPNQRYKVNPFGEDSTYRTTHFTPEEGLAVICLKRDPMGIMPWGFQLIRDEFGHACLVEHVSMNSPASAATFCGVPTGDSFASTTNTRPGSLNVNDMIIAVNGKLVGGMTETGLELELMLAAPNLLLVVSRYKHADQAAREYAEMERAMLDIMDSSARDNRLLGWREIGCGSEPLPTKNGVATIEKAQLSSRSISKTDIPAICSPTVEESFRHDNGAASLSQKDAATIVEKSKQISIDDKDDQINDLSSTIRSFRSQTTLNGNSASETSEDSALHDQNPQMGCICGAKHTSSEIQTFWIQCETCNSWYHVAKDCIGFDEKQANCPDFAWSCVACAPDIKSDEEIVTTAINSDHSLSLQKQIVCERELHKGSAELVANDVTREVQHNQDCEKRCQPQISLLNHYHKAYTENLTNSDNEDHQDPALPSEQIQVTHVSNDGLKSHGCLEPQSRLHLSSDPAHKSLLPKKKKKQRALRQLESHNGHGSGSYWELPNGSTRKRRTSKNESEKNSDGSVQNLTESSKPPKEQSSCTSTPLLGISEDQTTIVAQNFDVGDLVDVEAHSWAYVNNYGGIGTIQKAYIDEDGDRVYDVKYNAVRRREKGIMEEFIKSFSFG